MKVKTIYGEIKRTNPLRSGPFKRTWYSYEFLLTPTHIHIVIEDETDDYFFLTCIDAEKISVDYQLYGKSETLKILKMLEEVVY